MVEKIVVASQGLGGLDDYVSPVFARCNSFTIVEVEDGNILEVSTLNNPSKLAPSGAGIQAAQFIASTGSKVVIAGNFGPNALTALSYMGIRVVTAAYGFKVREAIEKYLEGSLQTRGIRPPMVPAPGLLQVPSYTPTLPKEKEIEMLRARMGFIKRRLREIEDRLKELGEKEEG